MMGQSLDRTSWIAWQFHCADLNEGVGQAFRRPEVANETLTVKLRGLDITQREKGLPPPCWF